MLFQVFGARRIGDPATYVVKLVIVAECDLQAQRHEVMNQVILFIIHICAKVLCSPEPLGSGCVNCLYRPHILYT